jgi:hypothetical protein
VGLETDYYYYPYYYYPDCSSSHSSKVTWGAFQWLLVVSRHPDTIFIQHRKVGVGIDIKAKTRCLEKQWSDLLVSGQLLVPAETSGAKRKRQPDRQVKRESIGALGHLVGREYHWVESTTLYKSSHFLR